MQKLSMLLAIAILSASCATSKPSQPVALTAELVSFTENGDWSDFSDGSFSSFHISLFRVVAPKIYCGKSLEVLHSNLPAADSPWRSVGVTYDLTVPEERAEALLRQEKTPLNSEVFYGSSWATIVGPSQTSSKNCQ